LSVAVGCQITLFRRREIEFAAHLVSEMIRGDRGDRLSIAARRNAPHLHIYSPCVFVIRSLVRRKCQTSSVSHKKTNKEKNGQTPGI